MSSKVESDGAIKRCTQIQMIFFNRSTAGVTRAAPMVNRNDQQLSTYGRWTPFGLGQILSAGGSSVTPNHSAWLGPVSAL